VSGRLALRRGVVVSAEPLEVEVAGERRRAWADTSLLGEMREGDEVVVNVAALDLGLGSGGFDVVHVNLTRGLEGGAEGDEHVMKLNYTSLQHPVEPVERGLVGSGAQQRCDLCAPEGQKVAPLSAATPPVLVLPLHGHLAPAAWAAAQARPGLRVGYVQTGGGALPGSLSRDVGIAALDNAHAALSLGLPTIVSPRLSSADPRARHRGLSHHTQTVLELALGPVDVAVPDTDELPEAGEAIASLTEAAGSRHRLRPVPIDLSAYAASGLPTKTMGRDLSDDPLFFAAALAAGRLLAE
jgi:hypothetical protein